MDTVQFKRLRYEVRSNCRWSGYATFFAGLAIFLLCVFFFMPRNSVQLGEDAHFGSFWMPLLILASFGVLMIGLRLKNPLPYGVITAVYCLYMIVYSVADGSGSSLLAVVWYILTAAVAIVAVLGLFPVRLLLSVLFLLPVIYRVKTVALGYFEAKDYIGFLPEGAVLCGLLAFAAFAGCMTSIKRKTEISKTE